MSTKLVMIYSDQKEINLKPLSSDYTIRFYQKGEADKWINVVTQSGEFDSLSKAQKRFDQEFKEDEDLLETRCLFLEDKDKEVVGTIMMWDGEIQNKKAYRIHWLSITPEHQGKGLSKHLLYEALKLGKDPIYLTTQIESIIGIRLYQNFGFTPLIEDETDKKAWHEAFVKLDEITRNKQ